MVEYGNGVSTVTGAAGGRSGQSGFGNGTMDIGAQAAGIFHDASTWVIGLGPGGTLLLIGGILLALILVRKAI